MGKDRSPQSQIALYVSQTQAPRKTSLDRGTEKRPAFRKYPSRLMKKSVAEMSKLKMLLKLFDVPIDPLDLLNRHRQEREPHGILSPYFLMGCEGRSELINQLERLDDSFKELHQYDPKEYFTEGSYRLANSKSSSLRKLSDSDVECIKDMLRKRYMTARHGTKKDIKNEIRNRFSVSDTTLDVLIKELKTESAATFTATD